MGAAAWTRKLARSFRPGCTDSEARAAQRALALSGPSTASEPERTPLTGRLPVPCQSRS